MRRHRTSNGRAQYGLVAAYSSVWHALKPEEGMRKGNDLRACPLPAKQVAVSLRHITPGMAIDFYAFYRSEYEREFLVEALTFLGLDELELPPSATTPILRVGRGSYADMAFLVERDRATIGPHSRALLRALDPQRPPFLFTGFQIPQ